MKRQLLDPPCTILCDIGYERKKNEGLSAFFMKHIRKAGLLVLFTLLSLTPVWAQLTVTLSTPTPVGAASMCPGTSRVTIYAFTLVASGGTILNPVTQFNGLNFNQSGSAISSDIVQYQLWSGTPGGTLVSTSTTPSFLGFSTTLNALLGTTINYWITADISSAATAGRTIIVNPMTTANFNTSLGLRATFGTIAAGGAQTVLLAPTSISGPGSVCLGSTIALNNGISGGTWSSSNTGFATVNPSTGVVTGVSTDGAPVITYQLPTGCLTTTSVNVKPLPVVYTVTGGGSYCSGGEGVSVGLSGSDVSVFYQLYYASSGTTDPQGTGSALDFGLQTGAGIYAVVATDGTTGCSNNMAGSATVNINPLPTVYSVTGGGTYCAGGSGFHIGLSNSAAGINYRLYKDGNPIGSPFEGSGSVLDFGAYTTGGNYTVLATNSSTLCINDMAGSATIVVNPLPNVYGVLGGGTICAGSAGVHIRLSFSQTGIIYMLYRDGVPVGSPVAGTGGLLLDLGVQTEAGNYTVVAMNASTYCTRNMSGTATVVVNPLPNIYAVTGGGSYCAEGNGVHVGLNSSDAGIMYLLYKDSVLTSGPFTGTGAAIDFGLQIAAGTYTVVAVNSSTTCMNDMAGSASVAVNPLPNIYAVAGGGDFCSGDVGVHIGLTGSNSGISYQLYNGIYFAGSPVTGTGSALDFGLQTDAGIYAVVASNISTMCKSNMEGNASVIVNPLPLIHNVTGGGGYCAGGTGVHVGLDGSNGGIIYLLSNGSTVVGSPMAGTGDSLDFGLQTGAGVYTVLAINQTSLCTQHMAGSAVVVVNPHVIPAVTVFSTAGDTTCYGTPITFNTVTVNGGTFPSYLWKVNGIVVTGVAPSLTYVPGNGDVVGVTMTSGAPCVVYSTVHDSLTMSVVAHTPPVVSLTAYPGTHINNGDTVTFTAHADSAGSSPLYKWYLNNIEVTGVATPVYVNNRLVNNDTVRVTVTHNDICYLSSSTSDVITVHDLGVAQLPGIGDITVLPNPSNGTFTIKGSIGANNTDVSLVITNMLGQVVYTNKIVANNGELNENIKLGSIPQGVYILNVRAANETKATHIVVE